jgi:hypothetical protein
MGLTDVLFGRPLASSEDDGERITPLQGIPTFGLDALSSAAYGPEAALTILLPLGLMGVHHIVPLTGAIIALLIIVFFSYRQTIAAYPNGGGSYTVAKENLGSNAGLVAAAALMIDYLLKEYRRESERWFPLCLHCNPTLCPCVSSSLFS